MMQTEVAELRAPEARVAAEAAVRSIGIRGVLEVLATFANELTELALNDKLARFRAASDHRNLVNLIDKVHH